MSAKKVSNPGHSSSHSASTGTFSFKEFTSVREEKNAIGIDQKKQSTDVATKLNNQPLLLAFSGRPTFGQKTSSGSGAGSTSMQDAVLDGRWFDK